MLIPSSFNILILLIDILTEYAIIELPLGFILNSATEMARQYAGKR